MSSKRPAFLTIALCSAAMSLSACENFSGNLFGAAAPRTPSCEAANDEVAKLQADNAKLKKQLADAMKDNATLRELAAKKW